MERGTGLITGFAIGRDYPVAVELRDSGHADHAIDIHLLRLPGDNTGWKLFFRMRITPKAADDLIMILRALRK